ncbi:hypothetical protein KRR38_35565 [Novosphingobium sp. G106]|uniref:hypothetical protein n=1 Tax=Novosphingobium sp. G106 TaxID=2849500 RepID=UPI001C2D8F47|nr:hypothetical protein [Novosphingobium sp. G106]MBV1692749.1 hypothetical protein [Novosphingobium sp. G106]MBV1692805.1 hypothetical protein [Novosphingobium sp. G106]
MNENQSFDGAYFEEERSVDVVNSRMGEAGEPRLKDVLAVITKHLHAAVKEIGSVAKIVKLEHAWRRLDGRNDDGFQVAPFPG